MSPVNQRRLKTVVGCLVEQSSQEEYEADPRSCVVDMLANLQHFCHHRDIDFGAALRMANDHFQSEKES